MYLKIVILVLEKNATRIKRVAFLYLQSQLAFFATNIQ